ncbi:hypothetical protein ACFO9E_03485 [Streptomyces maoxianensis]|uniref:Secreted protein n=1 Tax=Streptomyces maoxianensis TaxID=1459942 RepID=A0ABV9G1X3_9ACTN
MGEQWGTVVAAVIGFGGLFVGLIVGRRQVKDEAQVEHGQWLRGQRQEAYAQLLDAWDTAVGDTVDVTGNAERYDDAEQEGWDWGEHIEPNIRNTITKAWEPVRRAVERVELLGPQSAMETAESLRAAGCEVAEAASDFSSRWPNHEGVEAAVEVGFQVRRDVVTAFATVMQEAPRPGTARSSLPRRRSR